MKKTILIKTMFVACILAAVTYASDAQIKFGARAGLNLSNVGGDDSGENAMKIGYHVGGLVHIGIGERFSVQPEVLFSTKGTQDKDKSEYKMNLNYIDIPILANYKLESGVYFEAGPTVGILMSAKVTDGDNDVDVKEYMSGTDIGLGFGAGYLMEGGFGFGARYQAGLSNINKEGEGTNHNGVIMVNLMYVFGNAD